MFRKPGKTVILLVLIFVLCNVIAGAVSIKTALTNTRHSILERMGAKVGTEVDYNKIDEMGENFDYSSIGKMTKEIADDIAASPYVKRTDYTIESYCGIKGVHYYYGEDVAYESTASYEAEDTVDDPDDNTEDDPWSTEYFNFQGGVTEKLQGVEDEKIAIADGRSYTADEIRNGAKVAVVWDEFLKYNKLKIGDKLKIVNYIYDYDKVNDNGMVDPETKVEDEFEIIGTFRTIDEVRTDKDGEVVYTDNVYNNMILTPAPTVQAFVEAVNKAIRESGLNYDEYKIEAQVKVSFLIDSVDNVKVFEAQNKDKLPYLYKFTDNSDGFAEIEKPIKNMNLIADIVLYVAVGATVLVIGLLVALFLKDRTREMGIYLSLGERKWKIAVQILTEVMVIAIISVSLSIFSGNMLASKLGDGLLADQMNSTSSAQYWYDGVEMVSGDDFQEEYKVSLDGKTIGFIYAVGLGSVLVSTMIPIVSTLSIKPKKILM